MNAKSLRMASGVWGDEVRGEGFPLAATMCAATLSPERPGLSSSRSRWRSHGNDTGRIGLFCSAPPTPGHQETAAALWSHRAAFRPASKVPLNSGACRNSGECFLEAKGPGPSRPPQK
jgi:hypothetical protein